MRSVLAVVAVVLAVCLSPEANAKPPQEAPNLVTVVLSSGDVEDQAGGCATCPTGVETTVAQDMFLRSIWIHQTPSLNRASTCRIDVAHISGATVTEIVSLNYLIESVDASFGGQHEMIVIPGRGIQVLVGDKIRFDLTADFREVRRRRLLLL